MSVRSRIEAAGGSLIRQPDSQWVISVFGTSQAATTTPMRRQLLDFSQTNSTT